LQFGILLSDAFLAENFVVFLNQQVSDN
jgi:hypothetical protein